MTARYIALPTPPKLLASNQEAAQYRPTCEVFEADRTPHGTGLLDASGTPLYRIVDTVRLGFQGRGDRA